MHGQLVGVRFYPRDRAIRALVPAGIELTPPRRETSVGPGHRDFEIVADPSASIVDDMARRDFTVNAMARRLETGELVDPFGGLAHLERRELHTVSPESFREDPLRILRGLRLLSQLGFTLTEDTLVQMRSEAAGLRHVSGERIGGGLAADGMGELSKLLLGTRPAEALRIARDTGALVEFLPEYAPVIGHDLGSARQPGPLEEHLFAVVQETADLDAELSVRLCALLHDLGKPEADGTGAPTTRRSAPASPAGSCDGSATRTPPRRGLPARRGPRVLARPADRRAVRAPVSRLTRIDRARRLLLHKRADLARQARRRSGSCENLALLDGCSRSSATARTGCRSRG